MNKKFAKNCTLGSLAIIIMSSRLFALAGQSIFSLGHAYRLTTNSSTCNLTTIEVELDQSEIPLIAVGTLTTLWVRGRSRTKSLWQDFDLGCDNKKVITESGEAETTTQPIRASPLFPGNDPAKLAASILAMCCGVITCLGVGLQAYLGAYILLTLMNMTESAALIAIPIFCVICTFATFYSFILKSIIQKTQKYWMFLGTFTEKTNSWKKPN